MIDISKARNSFKNFLEKYTDQDKLGFNLKVVHTYQVVDKAKEIATKLNLSEEDIELAELIAILHDIGRFEQISRFSNFDNADLPHAEYGIKILFEDNLIRDFIDDDSYDEIIKNAILLHSKLSIPEGLDERSLLHTKIIRDADKLDNFRVKRDEMIEAIFPGKIKNKEDMGNSTLSDKVYQTVKERKCVDIHDRVTVLDYWVCVLAFIFDLNFKESFEIVKANNYINILIDRFKYNNLETQKRMEDIRNIINDYIDSRIRAN